MTLSYFNLASRRVRIAHLITQLRVVLKVASNHKSRPLGRILVWPFEDLASNLHSRLQKVNQVIYTTKQCEGQKTL